MAEHEFAESQLREQASAAKRRKRSVDEFDRTTNLGAELLDLRAAAAFLGSYVREDILQKVGFADLTFEAWCDQCNRLNWLAHRFEAQVAEAIRIFDGAEASPDPEGRP